MPLKAFLLSALLAGAAPALPQETPAEEKKLGWQDKPELALVITAGNSSTSTFGFGISFPISGRMPSSNSKRRDFVPKPRLSP